MGPGKLITFEGIDGCGKTTQTTMLMKWLDAIGERYVSMREPGGNKISENIRNIILDVGNTDIVPMCELLLFEASRAQIVEENIKPALSDGVHVICDRYSDSTFAYQAARGILDDVISEANRLGECGVQPDLTFFLDVDVEMSLGRATKDGADRIETAGAEYMAAVRDNYISLARANPERIVWIDASQDVNAIHFEVTKHVGRLLQTTLGF